MVLVALTENGSSGLAKVTCRAVVPETLSLPAVERPAGETEVVTPGIADALSARPITEVTRERTRDRTTARQSHRVRRSTSSVFQKY